MSNGKLRVAVVFGGKSGEHEVSLRSAACVIEALPKEKYEVVLVGIDKDGRWLLGAAAAALLRGEPLPASQHLVLPSDPQNGLVEVDPAAGSVRRERVDVVFPVLHGTFGEDGTMQGLLEMADLPYVGPGVAASSVGMDKVLMRAIFRDAGLPVVDSAYYLRSQWREQPEADPRRHRGALRLSLLRQAGQPGFERGHLQGARPRRVAARR